MQQGVQRKPDFLRQIVNRILAEERLTPQLIDEVRKRIGYAEEKYKFSTFGGDVSKLAEYMKSREFDELITVFKSGNALPVLKKILEVAKEKYQGYDELVSVIEEKLKKVESLIGASKPKK